MIHPTLTSEQEAFRDTGWWDGTDYVVKGEKVFITSGMRTDYDTIAVRTGGPGAASFAQACLEDALAWARKRKTFGGPLIGHQVIRHKRVDMQARIHSARALLYDTAWKLSSQPREPKWIAQLAMLKNLATDTMQFCANAAVQTLGGAGFICGSRAGRIYREAKVMQIGGGSTEIMKDLTARQLEWQP